jgi:Rod binding domain-containing protein
MSGPPAMPPAGSARRLDAPRTRDERAALRRAAHELEAVFLQQLFQAMRAGVPESGLLAKPAGEELFTSLLDERIASVAAQRSERGVGEALYRQLSRRLAPAPPDGESRP